MKIMFVCHGNICRSPMAEFVFKDMLAKRKVSQEYFVASSATSREELGNPVYPPAAAELGRHGISCKDKYAVQLTSADYDKYDLFICMDSNNLRNISRIFKDTHQKVHKLMDFTPQGGDVADPWYSRRFDVAYNDICRGCEALLNWIEKT